MILILISILNRKIKRLLKINDYQEQQIVQKKVWLIQQKNLVQSAK